MGMVLMGLCGSASAERADRDQPMNIQADRLSHDDIKKWSVFSGNVIVTKGSIVMRGGRLELQQDKPGQTVARLWPEPGQRAYFKQKREGLFEYMEGQAELIEYAEQSDEVVLSRQAQLKRLKGAVVADEIQGPRIVYNNKTEVFHAGAAGSSGASAPVSAQSSGSKTPPPSTGSRVRVMLSPSSDATPGLREPLTPAASDKTQR